MMKNETLNNTTTTTNSNNANSNLVGDESKKQGAYGKIQTHKESKISQLLHVDEVWAAIKLLYVTPMKSNMVIDTDDLVFCEEILVAVSRSFAAVIRQLPSNIGKDVAIFYLVLRALDTIEDDTTAFESHDEKVKQLIAFHETALQDPNWCMDGVGQGDEKRLLQEFYKVQRVYTTLSKQSQIIISDINKRMAVGMAEFVGKDLGQGTIDISEYNRYCHFVAGLVGEGLSRLFAVSHLEDDTLANEVHLSDQMGLFLQKTNIIRDFLEDYVDKRAFWPQSIWKKYSDTGELGYFCNQDIPDVQMKSLQCLNELIIDALELVPDCIQYMSKLHCIEVFRFCAIPQVMAIATLDKLYNNSNVFTGVVKIRKGLSCKLILRTNNIYELHETFYDFTKRILYKCNNNKNNKYDPHYERTIKICQHIIELTKSKALQQKHIRNVQIVKTISVLTVIVLLWQIIDNLSIIRVGFAALIMYVSIQFGPTRLYLPASTTTNNDGFKKQTITKST